MSKKDTNKIPKKMRIRCLRCGRISHVDLVAKCRYCDSFAVKLLSKPRKQNE